jgi:hypothetical protein
VKISILYWAWFVVTFVFIVVLPFFWVNNISSSVGTDYPVVLEAFLPEVMLSALTLLGLIGLISKFKYSVHYLVFVSVGVYPSIKLTLQNPNIGIWLISSTCVVILCILHHYLRPKVDET